MDLKLWIYEHFDLINSNINVKHNKFLYIHLKKLLWVQNATYEQWFQLDTIVQFN
jgi:hypothetical protein